MITAAALYVLLTFAPDGNVYVSDSDLSRADCLATVESLRLPEGFTAECVPQDTH